MEKWKHILSYLPVLGLLMVISAIPYGWSVYQRVGCLVLVGGYVSDYVANRRWTTLSWRPAHWIYVLMILLYLMFPLRQLFDATPPTDYFLRLQHRQEWFLFTGVVGLLGFSDKLKWQYVAYIMLLTSVVMAFHCGYLYWFTDEFDYCAPSLRFDLLRFTHIHSHMVMNLYINAALAFGFCCLMERRAWWQQALLIAAMGVSWLVILFSAGRIGIAASLLIVGIGSVYLLYRWNKRAGILIAAVAVVGISLVVWQRPAMSLDNLQQDPRLAIWDYSVRMAKEKPVFGYGMSTLSMEYVEGAYNDSVMYNGFVQRVIEQMLIFNVQGKTMETHHPHNAFLTYWLAFGVGGVLLLVALFVLAACLPVGERRVFLWLFLTALLMQCMTEPIATHLLPQFIAVMLFVWEKSVPVLSQSRTECG